MADDVVGGESPVPWLSNDEMAAWAPLAAVLVKLPAALDAQVQRDAGMNHFEYGVLATLSEAPDRTLRINELAARVSGSLSRLSHLVKRMEQRGWVRREPCPGDSRYQNVVLVDAGWAKVAAAAPGHVAVVRKLVIDPLSATQLGYLRSISARLVESLKADEIADKRR